MIAENPGPYQRAAGSFSVPRDAALIPVANWFMDRMVNRFDRYGAYVPIDRRREGRPKVYTANKRGDDPLTVETIVAHLRGERLIGLHSTSREGTCKWVAWDIDQHAESDADAERSNLLLAFDLCHRLSALGFRPLLFDSNGAGGFHVIVLFDSPMPSAHAYRFAKWVVRDCETTVETFPKQARLAEGELGNWLRLPGRHHSREHWSTLFDPHEEQWLPWGPELFEFLLPHDGDDPNLIPLAIATPFLPEDRRTPRRRRSYCPDDQRLSRAVAYAAKCSPAISGQQGHNQTFSVCCSVARGFDLSEDEALDVLTDWNHHCKPPWSDADLRRKIREALTKGSNPTGAKLTEVCR